MALRQMMGVIASIAATNTLAANHTRSPQPARTSRRIAPAQKKTSNIALARNQHETPINAPAPKAHPRLFRFAATSSIQAAAITIQLVGASASGTAPYVASKGQSAAITPAHNPTRQPNADTPTPTTSNTAKESSTH